MKSKIAIFLFALGTAQFCFAKPTMSHKSQAVSIAPSDCPRIGRDVLTGMGYRISSTGAASIWGDHNGYQTGIYCDPGPTGATIVNVVVSISDGKSEVTTREAVAIMALIAPVQGAQPGQPVYQQPNYQQPTQPVYQQPTYQQPTTTQPVYQQPTYQQPPNTQPVYQQPSYQQPPNTQPVYQQPTYQQPAYPSPSTPSYTQPTYQPPVYQPPVHGTDPNYTPPPYSGTVSWVARSGSQTLPTDVAIRAGTEADGRKQYVCRTRHDGQLLPGKAVTSFGTNCIVAYQNSEYFGNEFELLTGDPSDFYWAAPDRSRPAFYTGNESGVNLTSCRGKLVLDNDDKGIHGGKQLGGQCIVPYKGRSYKLSTYEVLYHR